MTNNQLPLFDMKQNIVIVGSGFAGTWSALAAKRLLTSEAKNNSGAADIGVIVVSPEPHLVMRPRLYEPDVAAKAVPLSDLFESTGVRFIQGNVDTINTTEKEVGIVNRAGERSVQSYDRLVLAAGSCLVRPNIPRISECAFAVDQLDDATGLEAHVAGLASRPPSLARNTIVVCGAGFTGIEVATEMSTRIRSILGREIDTRVILISRGNEIGDTLGPGPRPVIQKALRELNIETKLGVSISSIDAEGVTLATGERIETLTTIWTAGVVATPLVQQLPGKKDQAGRLFVDTDLRLPLAREVFATGDAACAAADDEGHTSLMTCQHAMPLGRVAGHNAAADLLNLPTRPYSQPTYFTCLDLGAYGAVLTNGWDRQLVTSGSFAKKIKRSINTEAIYPPDATDSAKALDAAHPKYPTAASMRFFSAVAAVIGFFGGRIV